MNNFTTSKERLRRPIRQWILNRGNVDRIHVIGAARSGTTLLHYSLVAFEHVRLCDFETHTVWNPSLRASLGLALETRASKIIYTTKRHVAWYRKAQVKALIEDAENGGVGIINIVRDPRDSMTSKHANSEKIGFYVDPDAWVASIAAGEEICEQLHPQTKVLTIRYEDMMLEHRKVQSEIERVFGLSIRKNVKDWSRLKSNVELTNTPTGMAHALHSLRDFDANSIGKWENDPEKESYWEGLIANPNYRDYLMAFMGKHNYL